jgi:hypothetical protein
MASFNPKPIELPSPSHGNSRSAASHVAVRENLSEKSPAAIAVVAAGFFFYNTAAPGPRA